MTYEELKSAFIALRSDVKFLKKHLSEEELIPFYQDLPILLGSLNKAHQLAQNSPKPEINIDVAVPNLLRSLLQEYTAQEHPQKPLQRHNATMNIMEACLSQRKLKRTQCIPAHLDRYIPLSAYPDFQTAFFPKHEKTDPKILKRFSNHLQLLNLFINETRQSFSLSNCQNLQKSQTRNIR